MKAKWILGGLAAIALSAASVTPAHAIFTLQFDEFGTGFVTQNGVTRADPGIIDANGKLAYRLPETVGLGDVRVAGPLGSEEATCGNASNCSDGLRFTTLTISAQTVYVMEYFSDGPDPNEPTTLADTGYPTDFNFTTSPLVREGTPENGVETFSYLCGADNCYLGVSDGRLAVPEPASLAIFGIALAGLGIVSRRRRKTV